MGYTFVDNCRTVRNITDYVIEGLGVNVVDYSRRGQELYVAVRDKDNPDTVAILVALLRKQDGVFGYKIMNEGHYPYYYNCPEKILKLSNYAPGKKWRLKCRAEREVEKIRKKIYEAAVCGQVLETQHGTVKYLGPYSKTQFMGQLLESEDPQKTYRVPISRITVSEDIVRQTVERLAQQFEL